MCYAGALIRSMAKVQGVVSMSSCEAELRALKFMCQESVGLVFLLERVLTSLEGYDVWVDSQACKDCSFGSVLLRRFVVVQSVSRSERPICRCDW